MPRAPTLSSRFVEQRSSGHSLRLLASWARRAKSRLRELGLRLAAPRIEAERPAQGARARELPRQRVVFVPAGTVASGGARLALTVDSDGIEVACELSGDSLVRARARLADPEGSLGVAAALQQLPEQFFIRTLPADDASSQHDPVLPAPPDTDTPDPWHACRATGDDMRTLIDRAQRGSGVLWIGWTVSRELAREHASALDEQLQDAMVALGGIFGLVTDGAVGTVRAPCSEAARGEGDRHAEEDDIADKRRLRSHYRERDRDRDSDPEGQLPAAATRDRSAALPSPHPSGESMRPLRPASVQPVGVRLRRGASRSIARIPLERGARVRVLEGPFAGKWGVVQELDGKGGARVMLGLLAVRLTVENLATERDLRRPRLSSSHRKPIPSRS